MAPSLDPTEETRRRIEEMIADPDSPVGIDAKKTHVLILEKLLTIEARLDELEQRLRR